MTPTHANKNGVRYRYYTSCVLAQGRHEEAGSVARVPAPEIEALVMGALVGPAALAAVSQREVIESEVERVVIRAGAVEVHRRGRPGDPLVLPWSPAPVVRKRRVIRAGEGAGEARPIRAEARERLLQGIVRARGWVEELVAGTVTGTDEIANRERVSERSVRMTLNLAFLAPDLVESAVAGTLPAHAGLSMMTDLPASWSKQRSLVLKGFER